MTIPEDVIKRLVLTWPLRQFRDDLQVPAVPPEADDWLWTYELRYGRDRHNLKRLEERRELLRNTLQILAAQGRNAEAAIISLVAIKDEILLQAMGGSQIDVTRDLAGEVAQIRKHLREGATRALKLYHRLDPANAATRRSLKREYGAALRPGGTRQSVLLYAKVLRAVQHDPMLRHASAGPRRRPKRGNPESVWIEQAKVALAKARVPEVLRGDLLKAIGLGPSLRRSAGSK